MSCEHRLSIEIRTHTGLHVLKGAVYRVLGAKWTSSVHVTGNHGRLTVRFERKPNDTEIANIETEANKKIQENAPVEMLEMDRAEAEARWGDFIYDIFPLPSSITKPTILYIPDQNAPDGRDFWNVNACNKTHTRTTGEVGSIKISKWRYRLSKQLLEISFDIE